MARVDGVKKLQRQLRKLRAQAGSSDRTSVAVGYTASYALYVHEAVEMKLKGLPRQPPGKGMYWDPQGRAQAKFLEAPFRQLAPELKRIIFKAVAGGATLLQGLFLAGLRVQRESQPLVPVDTGNLKGSAFTMKEPHGPPM